MNPAAPERERILYRRSSISTFGLLSWVAIVVALFTGDAVAATFSATASYRGGDQVASPWSGVGIQVPSGYQAGFDPDAGTLLLRSADGQVLAAVFAASRASVQDLGEVVAGAIQEMGIQLQLKRAPTSTPGGMDAEYLAVVDGRPGEMIGALRQGPAGNAVAVVALAANQQVPKLRPLVSGVVESLKWAAPQVDHWRRQIGGKVFYGSGSSSDYSPGAGGNHASYAGGSRTRMHFCSDGRYGYESSTKSYFSTGAGSVESSSQDAHQGQWQLIADFAGQTYLALAASDGREFLWRVQETAQGVDVDSRQYQVGQSDLCR